MKSVLLFLLFVSFIYAKEQLYIGIGSSYMQENFNTLNAKNSGFVKKLKIAYGDIKSYAVEFSLEQMKNNSKIFTAPSNNSLDGDKIGFNVELLKSFDFDIYVYPFVKLGFGTGYMSIERELQNSLSYGSFNITSGLFIPLYTGVDLEVAYEYRTVSYEAIDTIVKQHSHTSNANAVYFGLNVRF